MKSTRRRISKVKGVQSPGQCWTVLISLQLHNFLSHEFHCLSTASLVYGPKKRITQREIAFFAFLK
jgi:hypothetical protein